MEKNIFPTLLTCQASMIGSLTRHDLAILGGSYLLLSWMQVSGLYALSINVILVVFIKLLQRRLRPGFFRFLRGPRQLAWGHQLGNKNG